MQRSSGVNCALRVRPVLLLTVFLVTLFPCRSTRAQSLDLGLAGYGLSIGNSKRFTGIRINAVDQRVEETKGLNLTLWNPGKNPNDVDTVVLVHGLGRTRASMTLLRARLEDAGFRVVNFGYPSTAEEIEALVDSLAVAVERCCSETESPVHFVTHSMGGVLVRSYLADRDTPFTGRVVMLAPPNQGSEWIDAFRDSPLLRRILGPAGARLGTDSTGIAQELGPIDFSLGIITGDRSINPIGSWLIPGPDDGKVSIERAQLDGAAGFFVVPATHTFIMNRGDVAEQVVHFLRKGVFMSQGRGGVVAQPQAGGATPRRPPSRDPGSD